MLRQGKVWIKEDSELSFPKMELLIILGALRMESFTLSSLQRHWLALPWVMRNMGNWGRTGAGQSESVSERDVLAQRIIKPGARGACLSARLAPDQLLHSNINWS